MSTTTEQKSKLPYFLSLLLVVTLGISLAKLMWLILTPAPILTTNTITSPTNNLNNTQQTIKRNFGKTIADLHLFGEIKKEPVVKSPTNKTPKNSAPPPAKLNLKLHGIVAYKNKQGYALISSNGREQKVYGKGDTIEDGVTISDLFPEKVIIDNRGTREELLLPRKETKTAGTAPQPPKSFSTENLPNNRRRNMPPPTKMQNNSNPSLRNLGSFREKIIKNPKKLMDVAIPSPAYDNETDKFLGFRLTPGSNRQIFRQMGLRANDIVTSVNGITLDDPSKGAMVLGELSQASSVSLIVQRGDEIITLLHDF